MKTLIFQNSNENIARISALNFFVASLGLPEDLESNIINKKPTGSPKKLPGSPKEGIKYFRAKILKIFFLLFWNIDVLINSF